MTKRLSFSDRMYAVTVESFNRRAGLMLDRDNKRFSSRDEVMRRLYREQAREWARKANADHANMIAWASK